MLVVKKGELTIMKRIAVNGRCSEDIIRIMKVAIDVNILLTPEEADMVWTEHSDSYAAGWLGLPDDNDVLATLIERNVDKLIAERALIEE